MKIAKADPQIFHEEALNSIAVDGKGNKRMLMNLATLCLEEAARRSDKVVTPEIVNQITQTYY